MAQTVLVISDLHLGGAPDFQMCSPTGRALLTDFLHWVAGRAAGGEAIHLVVNGDLVDFLAEAPFESFTADDRKATGKLQAIITNSADVWEGFQAVAATGTPLTFLLGNHDLELTLPGPNALLRRTLGPGRIALLFGGEALDLGHVLIEHGNRCDSWNLVDHDALRALRSDISRRVPPPAFPVPPGSQLVVEVMNHVKRELRFVDLLKPETDAVLPLLAALASVSAGQIRKLMMYYAASSREHFGAERRPVDRGKIASTGPAGPVPIAPGASLALQMLAANASDSGRVGATDALDFLHLWRAAGNQDRRDELLGRLYEALRHRMAAQGDAFRIDVELPEYLEAAEASAVRGFKVVVYGHTHLAKCVALKNGGTYLNTGTWADLMRLPPAVVQGNRLAALGELEAFVVALQENRLDEWRRPRPTFASIVMDESVLVRAEVLRYDAGGVSHPLSNDQYV